MKPEYIQRFEKLGFGLFVHFGIYSILAKGEWCESAYNIDKNEYHKLANKFKVSKSWATNLVKTAKKAGARYITLTTRHHDGFSLYDVCGLSNFDAPHSNAKRDLVKEFVEACRKEDIVPMFYHTLIDWDNDDYKNNFSKYIDYLYKSVEILCTKYGQIGGFWFDGYWDKPDADWKFDRLYKMIRKYQPEAMIINNTGLSALGEVSHYDIDSVTFERGKPFVVSSKDGKERAGEVCDSLTDHWGYAKNDIVFKSVPYLIEELAECRYNKCNLLLNVGPLPNGELRPLEKYTLLELGKWIKLHQHIMFDCKPSLVSSDGALLFEDEKYYYALIKNVPMGANENVARKQNRPRVIIHTDKKIIGARYLDTKEQKVVVDQKTHSFEVLPFQYGNSLSTRTVRFAIKNEY